MDLHAHITRRRARASKARRLTCAGICLRESNSGLSAATVHQVQLPSSRNQIIERIWLAFVGVHSEASLRLPWFLLQEAKTEGNWLAFLNPFAVWFVREGPASFTDSTNERTFVPHAIALSLCVRPPFGKKMFVRLMNAYRIVPPGSSRCYPRALWFKSRLPANMK